MKKLLFLLVFIISFSIYAEHRFLTVGNVKIVRQEPLYLERQDLILTINQDESISVDSDYSFKNNGKYNIKITYMFNLDSEDYAVKNEYIKNIKFYFDYKKEKNVRALINFYEPRESRQIGREWFAITKTIKKGEIGKLNLSYDLTNIDFNENNNFVYSFDLVENLQGKNEAGIFYVTIKNKSDKIIESIRYKDKEFEKISDEKDRNETYELILGNEKLDGELVVSFKNENFKSMNFKK